MREPSGMNENSIADPPVTPADIQHVNHTRTMFVFTCCLETWHASISIRVFLKIRFSLRKLETIEKAIHNWIGWKFEKRKKVIFQGRDEGIWKFCTGNDARWARYESVRGTDQGRVRVLQSDLRTRCATARTRYTYPGCSHSLLSFRRPLHSLSLEFQSAYLPIVSLSAVFRNSTRCY